MPRVVLISVSQCLTFTLSNISRFLDASCVFLQGEDESQMDVMVRVLGYGLGEVHDRRRAVAKLRARLNERAVKLVEAWAEKAVSPQN